MKRTLRVLLLLLFPGFIFAQTPAAQRVYSTTTQTADTINLTQNGAFPYHRIMWSSSGTITTCQVKLQQSPTGLFAGEETDLITAQTCTSPGRSVLVIGNANFVRINPTTLTGGGTLITTYYGYQTYPLLEGTTGATLPIATVAADAYNDGTSAGSSGVPFTSAGTALNNGMVVAPRVWMGTQGDRMIACGRTIPKVINPTTATTTLLIPATAAQTNRICILEITSTGAQTVTIVVGTQTTNPCDTGQVTISPTYQLAANTNYFVGGTLMAWQNGTAVNQQVCAVTTAAISAFIAAHYTVY